MSKPDFVDEELFSVFIADCSEYIAKIYKELFKLEQNPKDKKAIDEIFRAVHSVKGSAGIIGFNVLEKIAHSYETVFDYIRAGKINFSKSIMEFMLEGLEMFEKIISDIKESGNNFNVEGIRENLKEFSNKVEKFLEKEIVLKETVKMIENGMKEFDDVILIEDRENITEKGVIYRIEIELKADELMPHAKLYLIYNLLSEYGKILKSNPDIKILEDEELHEIDKKAVFFISEEGNINMLEKEIRQFEIEAFKVEKMNEIEEEKSENKKAEFNLEENIEKSEDNEKEDNEKEKYLIENSGIKIKEFIKVEKKKLDGLFNIVGEIFIDKSINMQMNYKLEEIYYELSEEFAQNKKLKKLSLYLEELNMLAKNQDRTLAELQGITNSLRLVPVKELFMKFPIAVRRLSAKLDKVIEVELIGEDTELDKIIAEKMTDPLMHMIRNSVDHGLENGEERIREGKSPIGKITLEAANSGNYVILKVSDDGRGINVDNISEMAVKKGIVSKEQILYLSEKEKLNFIFLPGFSTAEEVSDISGRGVGMDVVKKNIESLHGKIEIETKKGKGTTIFIKLPLTLTITRALLSKVNGEIFAVSSESVVTIEKFLPEEVEIVNNIKVVRFRDKVVPVIELSDVFYEFHSDLKKYNLIIVRYKSDYYGLRVDEFINQQYIVIKNIEGNFHKNKYITGAAILGNGKLAMVIDIANLLD